MIAMDFNWIAKVLQCEVPEGSAPVLNINTDTRTVSHGEVFLALSGANFDGHAFVADAHAKGAIAAIVSRKVDVNLPQFVVADTRIALGLLGKAVIEQVKPKTIAITGSVGKTTVKEMCAAILRQKGKTLATNGNFNNDIGVPLTLLRLSADDEYAVIELGANHIGEIAYTTQLVSPDVATVCNVAPAHIEGFGSIDGVGQAKGEIFTGLKANGTALLNDDCSYANDWLAHLTSQQVQRFAAQTERDYWPSEISLDEVARATFTLHTPQGEARLSLPLSGRHNVVNAIIAAGLTMAVGATLSEVVNGLTQMGEVKGRVNLVKVSSQLTVIDDSYNANVKSVKAAIDLLADLPTKQVLVLGDMGELGPDANTYHSEIGEYAKAAGLDALFTLGKLTAHSSAAFAAAGGHYSEREALLDALNAYLAELTLPVTILVKGSRSARMELVAQALISLGRQGNKGEVTC
ncbi:UDP-N-acetylmuramoyl-tripeptide--D-alanyl-D-alanine ligase [Pseudoalteromonas fenneropenaei]|uniref:UDP-N-acetylmuramoyl-tripeptide--D-alanyl-D-alanine ligase n=1 Tax=Pseudoalteromonas fenneropenaei TaxID=1737459 RepID=A0ABV7CKR4_9GAMM